MIFFLFWENLIDKQREERQGEFVFRSTITRHYLVGRNLLLDRFRFLDLADPPVVLGPLGTVVRLAADLLLLLRLRLLLRCTGSRGCHHCLTLHSLISFFVLQHNIR